MHFCDCSLPETTKPGGPAKVDEQSDAPELLREYLSEALTENYEGPQKAAVSRQQLNVFEDGTTVVFGSTTNDFFDNDDRVFATLDGIFRGKPEVVRFIVSGGFQYFNKCDSQDYLGDLLQSEGLEKLFTELKTFDGARQLDNAADDWIKRRLSSYTRSQYKNNEAVSVFDLFKDKYADGFQIVPTQDLHADENFIWARGVIQQLLVPDSSPESVEKSKSFLRHVQLTAMGFEHRKLRTLLLSELDKLSNGNTQESRDNKRVLRGLLSRLKSQELQVDGKAALLREIGQVLCGLGNASNFENQAKNYQVTVILESVYFLMELNRDINNIAYPSREAAVFAFLRNNFHYITDKKGYITPSWQRIVYGRDQRSIDSFDPHENPELYHGFGYSMRGELIKVAQHRNASDLVDALKSHQLISNLVINLNGGVGEYKGTFDNIIAFAYACLSTGLDETDVVMMTIVSKILRSLKEDFNAIQTSQLKELTQEYQDDWCIIKEDKTNRADGRANGNDSVSPPRRASNGASSYKRDHKLYTLFGQYQIKPVDDVAEEFVANAAIPSSP